MTRSRIEADEEADAQADRIRRVEVKLDILTSTVDKLPTRQEIEAWDRQRVTKDEYTAAHEGLIERVARLENGPQRMLGWIALIVSLSGVLLSCGGFLTGIIIFLITHPFR